MPGIVIPDFTDTSGCPIQARALDEDEDPLDDQELSSQLVASHGSLDAPVEPDYDLLGAIATPPATPFRGQGSPPLSPCPTAIDKQECSIQKFSGMRIT